MASETLKETSEENIWKNELDCLETKDVAFYLRKNCKSYEGIAQNKRVEFFKGIRASKCLIEKYPQIKKKKHILYIMNKLMKENYFHCADEINQKKGKKYLMPNNKNVFSVDDSLFIWTFEARKWVQYCFGFAILLGFLFFVLQPLWPDFLKKKMSYPFYLSLVLLCLLLLLTAIRLILFVAVYLFSGMNTYFWLYPSLYKDEGFWKSFVPLYSIQKKTSIDSEKLK